MLAGAFRIGVNGTPGVVDIPPFSPFEGGKKGGM